MINKKSIVVRKRIQQKRPLIIHLYNRGVPLAKIQEKAGENYKTLNLYLMQWGLKELPKTPIALHKDWIIKNYTNREMSIEEMAKKIGTNPSSITNMLRLWGIPRERGFYRKKTHIMNKHKQDIIDYYVNKKWTTAKIAKKYNLAACTVQLKLKEWGIPARTYQKVYPDKVKKLYDKGLSPQEIADECDSDTGTVYKVLSRKLGIHHTKKVQFSPAEDALMSRFVLEGLSVPIMAREINRRFNRNITTTTIYRRLKELGLEYDYPKIRKHRVRNNKPYSKKEENSYLEKIREMRKEGISVQKIADEIRKSRSFVARMIKKYNIPRVNKVFTPEVKSKVAELYKQGLDYSNIAEKLGLKDESVRQELTRMGFPRLKSKFSKTFTPRVIKTQNEIIKKYYGSPYYKSIIEIAKALRIDKTTVKARLQKMGIPIMSSTELRKARKKRFSSKKNKRIIIDRTTRKILEGKI